MTPLNFRSLDLNLLRVFDEVMAERSLTRAAHKLSVTQPAVSNAMRRLRDVLGDELVVRSGRGVEPTARALALWPPVREALAHLQESLAPGHFEPATAESTFVLAMADATAATLVPALVEIIEREAPGISIRVLPLTTRDPRRLLDEEAADMAVGYFPAVLADLTARAQSGGAVAFESRRLYDGEYVCVMRQGHPLLPPGRGGLGLGLVDGTAPPLCSRDRHCRCAGAAGPAAGRTARACGRTLAPARASAGRDDLAAARPGALGAPDFPRGVRRPA